MPAPAPRRTNQIKGVLLEEVVLALLRRSGYRTVLGQGLDPTLGTCSAGLQVKGRGGEHQIDAIADYCISPPFSYPQRLLVEAKCFAVRDVDLDIVRNALGVFRDVSEFWTAPPGLQAHQRHRYHYQYSIFSSGGFTAPAQRFAFAHDIHLLPLGHSAFIRPLISALEKTARDLAELPQGWFAVGQVRSAARSLLQGLATDSFHVEEGYSDEEFIRDLLEPLRNAFRALDAAYLTMIGGVFPVFLVPDPDVRVGLLAEELWVRILYDDDGWFIVDEGGRRIFSFDLPDELFNLYAESGALTRSAAVQLKGDFLSELQIISVDESTPRVRTLRLDPTWLSSLSRRRRN